MYSQPGQGLIQNPAQAALAEVLAQGSPRPGRWLTGQQLEPSKPVSPVHFTPEMTGQPVCSEYWSLTPSGLREKKSSASPFFGLAAQHDKQHRGSKG